MKSSLKKTLLGVGIGLCAVAFIGVLADLTKQDSSSEGIYCPHESVTEYPAVAATCTEEGRTRGEVCVMCGSVLKAMYTVPAHGHTPSVIEEGHEATCTDLGLTDKQVCTVCDTVLTEQLLSPALGHVYDDNRLCTVCGRQDYELSYFENKFHYTEVAAVNNEDKFVGNYFRLKPSESAGAGNNIYIEFKDFTLIYSTYSGAPVFSISRSGFSSISVEDVGIEYVVYNDYVDFYVPHSFFFENAVMGNLTVVEVTKDSTFRCATGGMYKLIPQEVYTVTIDMTIADIDVIDYEYTAETAAETYAMFAEQLAEMADQAPEGQEFYWEGLGEELPMANSTVTLKLRDVS